MTSAQPPILVGSPADVLAVVPRLLGFHPTASLVVIGCTPPRGRVEFAFRYDLPDPPDPEHAADIASHATSVLCQRGTGTAVAVGYGPGALVTPVADVLRPALQAARLRLHEFLRVENGRYWSYLCCNPDCCPADGVPFDLQANQAAAAMTVAGLVAMPDRAALAATVAPVTGPEAQAMERATRQALERAAALAEPDEGRQPGESALIEVGLCTVRNAIDRYRGGGHFASDDEVAWLSVVLALLPVRDDAWARMDPGPALQQEHLRLWSDVVRRARPRYRAAPASLLAFTAWQSGEGALANIAIDLALGADPDYSLALLLRDVLSAGVPPSAARLPMSPEEVAASYQRRPPLTAADDRPEGNQHD